MTVWNNYRIRKTNELVEIDKIFDKEHPKDSKIRIKQFDINTGTEVGWIENEFKQEILINQKNQLLEAIKDIDALITDLTAIKEVEVIPK